MAAEKSFFITTAIAYPNGAPHIGHAYEYIATDTIARFKRLDGFDVFYLTGTDEHGLKMQQTAAKEGIETKALADRNATAFEAMQRAVGATFDRFIRTTDADHFEASKAIWARMRDSGDIYLGKYSGWYSVRDEAYYAADETTVTENGFRVSTVTGTEVEWTEEASYFFRLSAYQDRLLKLFQDRPGYLEPATRRNEVVSFISGGLRDLSISRDTFDWGVPVPGDPEHVMYVWVDALTNYLTGAGYPDIESERFRRYWPPQLQMIGKDIIRFHAVYWPAFLMSAGIELPERVFAHGFLFNKGEKMSKSVGNVVDPYSLIEAYGLDPVRYFLLREVSFGQDGSYSHEAIVGRINADLANELGNLAQRSLSMINKNCGGRVPEPGVFTADDGALLARVDRLLPTARAHVDDQALHLYLESIWSVLAETNRYFTAQEPWKLKAADPERMGTVLYVTAEVVRQVALLLQPVMPDSTAAMLDLLAQPAERTFAALGTRLVPGAELPKPQGVFPRYLEPEG